MQIDNPASAVSILGTAAPLTSLFFLTYILLQVRIITSTALKTSCYTLAGHSGTAPGSSSHCLSSVAFVTIIKIHSLTQELACSLLSCQVEINAYID